jgi:hypothetical protein
MWWEPFREVSAVKTGVPCPKVAIHRKLGHGGKDIIVEVELLHHDTAMAWVNSRGSTGSTVGGLDMHQGSQMSNAAAIAAWLAPACQRRMNAGSHARAMA